MNTNRRNFIVQSVGAVASIPLASPAQAATPDLVTPDKKVQLSPHDIIFFQGDSITDWGRDKKQLGANNTAALNLARFSFPIRVFLIRRSKMPQAVIGRLMGCILRLCGCNSQ
jgi:hypothetical protein